jgi:hypothetical protein
MGGWFVAHIHDHLPFISNILAGAISISFLDTKYHEIRKRIASMLMAMPECCSCGLRRYFVFQFTVALNY